MTAVELRVPGDPIPQGSMRWLPNKRMTDANPRLHNWRARLSDGLATAISPDQPMTDPIYVWLDFFIRRPKGHYGAHGIRERFRDARPAGRPDLDKLCRAVLDAATDAGVWRDDGQVVRLMAAKHWADDEQPGVAIYIDERGPVVPHG